MFGLTVIVLAIALTIVVGQGYATLGARRGGEAFDQTGQTRGAVPKEYLEPGVDLGSLYPHVLA